MPSLYRKGCDQWYSSDALQPCEFGNLSATKTVVVLGDSIGLQWFPAIERIFDAAEWRIVVMTKSACPIVDEPIFYARIGREYTECARWRNAALARITELVPEYVILGSTQTYDYSPQQWRDGTARVLQKIAPAASNISILLGTPLLPFDGPDCIAPRSKLWSLFAEQNCTAPAKDAQSEVVSEALSAAASRYSNVQIVDMTEAVCPDGVCSAIHDGMPTYRDNRHLTARFVTNLASPLAAKLVQYRAKSVQ